MMRRFNAYTENSKRGEVPHQRLALGDHPNMLGPRKRLPHPSAMGQAICSAALWLAKRAKVAQVLLLLRNSKDRRNTRCLNLPQDYNRAHLLLRALSRPANTPRRQPQMVIPPNLHHRQLHRVPVSPASTEVLVALLLRSSISRCLILIREGRHKLAYLRQITAAPTLPM